MGGECDGVHERNVPHHELPGKYVNCRNVWFREFWSQHHKCTFSPSAVDSSVKLCTGTEELVDYKQEGLVPFVGKFFLFAVCIYVYIDVPPDEVFSQTMDK